MFRQFIFLWLLVAIHQNATLQERALHEGRVTTVQDTLARGMEELVVTGSMRPVKKLECPVVVEVYSQQFFRKNPVPSIFEALQLVNGVRPQLNCNICNTGDIHINGLDGPYTMVTIDGMPIVSGLSTVYGLFGIPNQMIDRVEIVKGPASGLYGSEAVGGLINIITKSPSSAPAFSADIMATGWREFQADAGVKWKMGRKIHVLSGLHMYHYDHPVDRNQDNFTDMALQKRVSAFMKWSMDRPGGKAASTGIRFFHEDRWGGEMQWTPRHRGGDKVYGESIYTRRFEWIGQYGLPLSLPITLSWSYNYHDQDSYYGVTPFMAQQHIGFGQLTWQGRVRDHKMLAGAALRFTKMDDNTPATLGQVRGIWLPGIFLQDEFTLGERHELLTGLRYDHHPVHGGILTPRLAWKWKTGGSGVFRLNAGTGFRVVNVFTEDHAALTGAREVVIAETLDPERSYNINLNYGHRLPLGHSVLSLDASAWYTHFSNRIMPDYDTDPDRIIYRNLEGHSVSRGLSLNLTLDWGNKVRLLAGATLQDVFLQERRGDKYERVRPVLTENWSAVWTLTYNTPLKGLGIDYTGSLYGPMRLPLAGKLDPRPPCSPVWALQNLQLTFTAGRLAFYGGVKNLFNWTPARSAGFLIARAHDPFDRDVQYDAGGDVLATSGNPYALTFDPTYMYAPNQGRRLFLGMRLTVK